MTFGEGTYKRIENAKAEKKEDLKIGFIETNTGKVKPTKPVVIPSAVKTENVKKLAKKEEIKKIEPSVSKINSIDSIFEDEIEEEETDAVLPGFEEVKTVEFEEDIAPAAEENQEEIKTEEPAKRKRGRPRKVVDPADIEPKVPKKRGRPRKVVNPVPEEQDILPGFEDIAIEREEDSVLPGFEASAQERRDNSFNLYSLSEEEETREKSIDSIEPRRRKYRFNKITYKG